MHPVLVDFGFDLGGVPVRLYSYGLCMVVGLVLALIVYMRGGARRYSPIEIYFMGIILFMSGLVGSKILFILVNIRYYADLPWPRAEIGGLDLPLPPFRDLLGGGMVWYGGVVLALPVGLAYTAARRMDFLYLLDCAAPAISIGHLWGRLGCFLAGCCYGSSTSLPWAARFPEESVAYQEMLAARTIPPGSPSTLPVHPTQLYDALAEGAILIALVVFARRKSWNGQIGGLYLLLYAAARFVIEFARGDGLRGDGLGLSTSQWVAMPLFVVGAGLLAWRWIVPARPQPPITT